jgi:hypothetical protein
MRHAAFLLLITLFPAAAPAQRLTYRGFERLPERQAPGLSGITYAGDGAYWGVLEWEAKLVRLRIATRADDASIESVKIDRAIPMRKGADFEGVAFTPGRPDTVMVSTEAPEIVEVSLTDGRGQRALVLPRIFEQIVRNQGLESLTFGADGNTLWTANERALKIDGNPQQPVTPFLSATRVRLLRYERKGDTFEPAAQFGYQTGGVHGAAGQIGLCDLAALPDGRLLALERSAAQGLSGKKSIRTRIYLCDATGATDISRPPFDKGLVDQSPVKVAKTLLFDGFVCDADGENLEGLCVGPELSPGRFDILGVVDNTDGGVGVSRPAIVAFELDLTAPPVTQPATTQPHGN